MHRPSIKKSLDKLMLNVEMFIYFFVFCWIKKRDKLLHKFFNESTQQFINLEGVPNYKNLQAIKNTKKNPFNI